MPTITTNDGTELLSFRGPSPVARWVRWMGSWHWVLLLRFSPTPPTKPGQVHPSENRIRVHSACATVRIRLPVDAAAME
jgi:hypothetical protein